MTWDNFLAIALVALASLSVVYRFTKKPKSKCGGNCGCCQSQGSTPPLLPMTDKECEQCAPKHED